MSSLSQPAASLHGRNFRRHGFGFDFLQDPRGFAALNTGNVILVLEQRAERRIDRAGIERDSVSSTCQRLGPADRLGDAGILVEVGAAQLLDERDDLAGQCFARLRHLEFENGALAFGTGIVDPVIEAASPHRIVNFARPIGRQDRDRRLLAP